MDFGGLRQPFLVLAAAVHLLPGWYNRLLWAAIAIVLAGLFSRLGRWWLERLATRGVEETRQLTRLRRRETAVLVLSTALRYIVSLLAAFAVLGIFVRNTTAAIGGATLVMIVVGFGFQRLLADMLSGFLVLFESWYGVGDFVRLQPMNISGFVEEFGLRTTVVRSLNGDRTYVPNGQITAASRSPQGYRRYSIELMTTDPQRARKAVEKAARLQPGGEARFLRPPYVVAEEELTNGVCLIRAQCDVPPTMEWLAETYLPTTLRAELDGDGLLTEPMVYTLDESAVERYERRVLVR